MPEPEWIPDIHRPALERIASLSDEQAGELIASLEVEAPTERYQDYLSRVTNRTASITPADISDIVTTLLPLFHVQAATNRPAKDFALAVATSADLALSDDQRAQLEARLRKIFDIESLRVTAKALEVITSYERYLMQSQVLTDIRPIFGDAVESPLPMAAIVHTLRLQYGTAGQIRDFFVSMSPSQVRRLREVLDRAEGKADTLRNVLRAAHIPSAGADRS